MNILENIFSKLTHPPSVSRLPRAIPIIIRRLTMRTFGLPPRRLHSPPTSSPPLTGTRWTSCPAEWRATESSSWRRRRRPPPSARVRTVRRKGGGGRTGHKCQPTMCISFRSSLDVANKLLNWPGTCVRRELPELAEAPTFQLSSRHHRRITAPRLYPHRWHTVLLGY